MSGKSFKRIGEKSTPESKEQVRKEAKLIMEEKKPKTWTHPGFMSNAGNWEEDFDHENGNYINECKFCHKQFLGHKRRPICKTCFNEKSKETQTGLI